VSQNKIILFLRLNNLFPPCLSLPLGSTERGNRTLVDEALESFGISIPLIEFHEIQSRCPNSTEEERNDHNDPNIEGNLEPAVSRSDDSDSDDDEVGEKVDWHRQTTDFDKIIPVHKLHPHIVTQ
jgi:hypothetical protein